MAKDWRQEYRCPTKKGRVKPQKSKGGTCFVIERVKRDKTEGYTTTLHNRATGRRTAYSAPPKEGKGCPTTQDPFRADIRTKSRATTTGAACARRMSAPKKPLVATQKRRKASSRPKSKRPTPKRPAKRKA